MSDKPRKKRKKANVWTHFDENKVQIEDVVFEVAKLEDIKKQMAFDDSGTKVDIKAIKSSDKYQKQHEKAVKLVCKYNNEQYKGAIDLSTCRAILQMRIQDAKLALKNQLEV